MYVDGLLPPIYQPLIYLLYRLLVEYSYNLVLNYYDGSG